jgi:Uma2 family endonuclease
VAKVLNRTATYEDLMAVPDNMVAEIVDGELFASPRPGRPHAYAESALFSELYQRFHRGDGGPGGWWIIFEPELHLGAHILVPDIGGWRRERVPEYPDAGRCEIAPDWICEIVSPRTAALDRVRKLPLYARYGVLFAWIVDPDARSLEVYRAHDGRFSLEAAYEGDARVRAEPFEAVELNLGAFWLP